MSRSQINGVEASNFCLNKKKTKASVLIGIDALEICMQELHILLVHLSGLLNSYEYTIGSGIYLYQHIITTAANVNSHSNAVNMATKRCTVIAPSKYFIKFPNYYIVYLQS